MIVWSLSASVLLDVGIMACNSALHGYTMTVSIGLHASSSGMLQVNRQIAESLGHTGLIQIDHPFIHSYIHTPNTSNTHEPQHSQPRSKSASQTTPAQSLEQSQCIRRRPNRPRDIERRTRKQETIPPQLLALLRKRLQVPKLANRHPEQRQEVLVQDQLRNRTVGPIRLLRRHALESDHIARHGSNCDRKKKSA
jgi:hypothetical protein